MYYRGMGAVGIDPVTAVATYQTAQKLLDESRALWDAHPKDKARFEANLEASQLALQGSADALAYLHQRSGKYPAAVVDFNPTAYPHDAGEPIAGWATLEPKQDAARKEQQVAQARGISTTVAGITGSGWFPLALGAGVLLMVLRGRR